MNKTCTNPACRRTFSTLNFFGACPFCRKSYPQLAGTRKLMGNAGINVMLINGRRVQIDIAEMLRQWRCGQKIKAIKALRQEIEVTGYRIHLKDARDLTCALIRRRNLRSVWDVDEESWLIRRSEL